MQIIRVTRTTAAHARGVTIVIDVIRAFTVAGYAFANGAQALWLVRDIEEAQALRKRAVETSPLAGKPRVFLAGEIGGKLIPGFDFNNSPALMSQAHIEGSILIQRTGAGTQGAVSVAHTPYILLCAFTNAQATATYARKLSEKTAGMITLLPTGAQEDFAYGNEDVLCADYVESLLQERPDAEQLLAKSTAQLWASDRFDLWKQAHADFPYEDIAAVLDANRFNFAMVGTRKEWQGTTYVEVVKQPI
jgi:2-phosphosulfolactate phosphatase